MKKYFVYNLLIISVLYVFSSCSSKDSNQVRGDALGLINYNDTYRPQLHFTPPAHWMNDPNGMVYYEGEYHLFYQYYPDSTVWGPMHWGHAVSPDLIHWQHLPIALFPDSLGYIFSGSAVVDYENASGLGTKSNPPIVAIFTYHNQVIADAGSDLFQTQGIAYSLDKGRTWVKYDKNPVLENPGIRDFRDPKVSWNDEANKWIMALAAYDHIQFYSSQDLIQWTAESSFGKKLGNHGGIWECPDIFKIPIEGSNDYKWVLLVSINEGAPNGGSGTQYFIGDFDGSVFTPDAEFEPELDGANWIDYGTDNYAGVTWSGTQEHDGRTIFLGWMSNWQYAQVVPTEKWRSAMTIPRTLKLYKTVQGYRLASQPVSEIQELLAKEIIMEPKKLDTPMKINIPSYTYMLSLKLKLEDKSVVNINLSNDSEDIIKYTFINNKGFISMDRTHSGNVAFSKLFPDIQTAPLFKNEDLTLRFIVDVTSIELFVNEGYPVITSIMFPEKGLNHITLSAMQGDVSLTDAKVEVLNSIYK